MESKQTGVDQSTVQSLNGNDVFRKEYTPLTDEAKAAVATLKDKALELWSLIDQQAANAPREIATAKTHLETSIMWAIKGITK